MHSRDALYQRWKHCSGITSTVLFVEEEWVWGQCCGNLQVSYTYYDRDNQLRRRQSELGAGHEVGSLSSFDVEYTEPYFDPKTSQYLIIGTLRLKVGGSQYRVLTKKLWLTTESRYNESWYRLALRTIRDELVRRAKSEIAAVMRYQPPQQVAEFKRIAIPLMRRVYPQLIANNIVSVQPMTGPTTLDYYLRWRYSTNGNTTVRWRSKHPGPTNVDWKKEGF